MELRCFFLNIHLFKFSKNINVTSKKLRNFHFTSMADNKEYFKWLELLNYNFRYSHSNLSNRRFHFQLYQDQM